MIADGSKAEASGEHAGRVHVVIPTHTTRHLAACLAGIGRQEQMPASVVVSCDTDDPAIGNLLDEWWPPMCGSSGTVLIHVARPHKGYAHPAQVRNNGFRAIERMVGLRPDDTVLGIDGDIVLGPEAVWRHAEIARDGAELVLGFRICLSEAATTRVTPWGVMEGADRTVLTPEEEAAEYKLLEARQARYEKSLLVRNWVPSPLRDIFVKPHKPKLISAHYAVKAAKLLEVNGFDEEYRDYGYEDDDLGRRLHAAGARTRIGVRDILAYHLWHPTRAPKSPMDTPGYSRFSLKGLPKVAAHGIRNPMPQDEPVMRVVSDRQHAAASR